jgi:hypothetical protein
VASAWHVTKVTIGNDFVFLPPKDRRAGQPNMEGLIPIVIAVAWIALLASSTSSSLVGSSFELPLLFYDYLSLTCFSRVETRLLIVGRAGLSLRGHSLLSDLNTQSSLIRSHKHPRLSVRQSRSQVTKSSRRPFVSSKLSQGYRHIKISHLLDKDKLCTLSILQWAVFALCPLTILEITKALLIVNNNSEDLLVDELPDTINEDYINSEILGLCGSLLETPKVVSKQDLGSMILHLAHFYFRPCRRCQQCSNTIRAVF